MKLKTNLDLAHARAGKDGNMQTDFRNEEFYERKIGEMSRRMAELLAEGKTLEIGHSRTGIKMYSFKRKAEIFQKEKTTDTTPIGK